jgi:hypothetical protein
MVQKVKAGDVAVRELGVFQVADVDARNGVKELATEGIVDCHIEAVDGHSMFVELIVLRDLGLRCARFGVGRGSNGDDEGYVGQFGIRIGGERQGHVTMSPTAVEAGNGRGVGAELALGQEKRRIGGCNGIGGDWIEDFVRKVGDGKIGRRGHDGRGQDRRAVGQGWDQKDGWVAL